MLYPRRQFYEWYNSTTAGNNLQKLERDYLSHCLIMGYEQNLLTIGASVNQLVGKSHHCKPGNHINLVAESNLFNLAETNVFGSYEQLPLATESIDRVVLIHVLEFTGNYSQVLNEIHRVLEPEGQLVILAINPWSPFTLVHRKFERQYRDRMNWRPHYNCTCYHFIHYLNKLNFATRIDAGFNPWNQTAILEPNHWFDFTATCFSMGYAIQAIKRTQSLIPLKPGWSLQFDLLPSPVGEPTSIASYNPLLRKTQTNSGQTNIFGS